MKKEFIALVFLMIIVFYSLGVQAIYDNDPTETITEEEKVVIQQLEDQVLPLNDRLEELGILAETNPLAPEEGEEVISKVRARRPILQQIIPLDPDTASNLVLYHEDPEESEFVGFFPEDAREYIEKPVDIMGFISIYIVDFADRAGKYFFELETPYEKLKLYPVKGAFSEKVLTGDYVRVQGYRFGDIILVDDISKIEGVGGGGSIGRPPPSQGDVNVLIVRLSYQDKSFDELIAEKSISMQDVEKYLDNFVNFYKENSYGKLNFHWKFFDYTLERSSTSCPSGNDNDVREMSILVKDGKIPTEDSDIVVGAVPRRLCDMGVGIAFVGFGIAVSQVDIDKKYNGKVISHEVGHTLGLSHVDDTYSLMHPYVNQLKGDNPSHFTAEQKGELHWLDIGEITSPGEYTFSPYEIITPEMQAIKIPYRKYLDYPPSSVYFYYKTPQGYDQFSKAANLGIFINSYGGAFPLQPGKEKEYFRTHGTKFKVKTLSADWNGLPEDRARMKVNFCYVDSYSCPDGLLGYWRFEKDAYFDGEKIDDDSLKEHDGLLFSKDKKNKKRDGIFLDGKNDYIHISSPESFNPGRESFSISLWIYPEKRKKNQMILSKLEGGENPTGYYFALTKDQRFYASFSDGSKVTTLSTEIPEIQRWYHLVIVRDSLNKKIYIYKDGVKVAEADDLTEDIYNSQGILLGSKRKKLSFGGKLRTFKYYKGEIDEVAIMGGRLSEYGVYEIYYFRKGRTTPVICEEVVKCPENLALRRGESLFLRGDANEDKRVDLSDAVHILGVLFQGKPQPACVDSADTNDDGRIDISDAITLLDFLFKGGKEIPKPYPLYGNDPTDDILECLE